MEEEPLTAELQEIANMVASDDIDEEMMFNHTSSIIGLTNGNQEMSDVSNEFTSLSTKAFANREDLIRVVRKIGLMQKYALVVRSSKANRYEVPTYVVIGCDRGGSNRSKIANVNKKRNSSSRLINCPFRIIGDRTAEDVWKVQLINLLHNHEPSSDMAGHPYCHRFTEGEALQVKQMTVVGIKPRQILSSLRQSNPGLLAVSRNVYSKTAEFRKESLDGCSVIQALLDELGEAGFLHNVKYDHYGHLTHLFFAHPLLLS